MARKKNFLCAFFFIGNYMRQGNMHTSSLKQNNFKPTPQEAEEVLNDYEAEEQNK